MAQQSIDRVSQQRRLLRAFLLGTSFSASIGSAVMAGPTGEKVVKGNVTFTRSGDTTIITASNNSIINYKNFSIGSGESVTFLQPGSSSRVLNRVLGGDISRIDGSLTANGRVYFVNPAGIFIGHGALVNVGAIYAAAGNISNDDFIANRNRFTGVTGSVINWGTITGRDVALVGRTVLNAGSIVSDAGTVTMVAGNDVFISSGGSRVFAKFADAAGTASGASSTGSSDTGAVSMIAGDAISAAVANTGSISATSATGKGGSVKLVGEKVSVTGSIDASGATGGGSILVGGDLHGQAGVTTASTTTVSNTASLTADATVSGDGGKVIVWSDVHTSFSGSISARGANGGAGGFAEVSSKGLLSFDPGTINLGGGQLLLDPKTITIQDANPDILGDASNGDITTASDLNDATGSPVGATTPADVDSIITSTALNTILATTNVTLQASESITNNASATKVHVANGVVLTVDAPTINLNQTITLAGTGSVVGGASVTLVNVGAAATITQGIAIAPATTTVSVAAGTFTESFTVNKALTLKGAQFGVDARDRSATETVIDVSGGTINLAANNITIDGFTISGNTNGAGLTLSPSFSGYHVSNNIITNNTFGVNLGSQGTNQTVLSQNWIKDNNQAGGASGDGIYSDQVVKNVLISDSKFSGNANASAVIVGPGSQNLSFTGNNLDNTIVLANVDTFTISGNAFNTGGNSTAIYLDGNNTGTNSITFNDITNVTKAIYFVDDSAYGANTGSYNVANNNISDANVAALKLDAGTLNGTLTFNNNSVTGSAVGVLNNSAATVDATLNWWGTAVDADVAALITGAGTTNFRPYLASGNNTLPSGTGFTGDFDNGGIAGGGSLTGVIALLDPGSILKLAAGSYDGLILAKDFTIVGAGSGSVTITGNSPALTVNAGNVSVSGVTLTTATDAPTVLVTDGNLTLRDSVVQESSAFNQFAVKVTGTGTADLGTVASAGGNTFNVNGAGKAILNDTASNIQALGNTFTVDAVAAADNFAIEDLIDHGTDTAAKGLVYFVDKTVFVTPTSGSINRAIAASTANDTITIKSSTYAEDVVVTKSLKLDATDGTGTTANSWASDTGTTTGLSGNFFSTAGGFTFTGAVVLQGNTVLDSDGLVWFKSFINDSLIGAHSLAINGAGSSARFDDLVGEGTELGSLVVQGAAAINGGGVVTTTTNGGAGFQTYQGAVTLGADTVLLATGVTGVNAQSTIDAASAGDQGLTINGNANFNSVGGGAALKFVTVSGTTNINSGNVVTTGLQAYSGALSISGDTTFASAASGNITFGSTVDSGFLGNLIVNTQGTTWFKGDVGSTGKLGSVTTDAGGTTKFGNASLVTITTTGNQTYNDNAVLAHNTLIVTTDGGNVAFNGTIDSLDATARGLTINTTFTGAAVDGNAGSITFGDGGADNLGSTFALSTLATTAAGKGAGTSGVTTFNIDGGNTVTTTGDQTFNNAVVLAKNTTLATNTGVVTFNNTLDGTGVGTESLAITGNANFTGTVGGTKILDSLTVSGFAGLGADITTAGLQTYTSGVEVRNDITLTSIDDGDITFGSTVDTFGSNSFSLTVNTSGVTWFKASVGNDGGDTILGSLTTDAGGSTKIGSTGPIDIRTNNGQTYNDNVVIISNASFTDVNNGNITFAGTLNGSGAGFTVAVNTAGQTWFKSTIGDSADADGLFLSLTTYAGGTTKFGTGAGATTYRTNGSMTFNDAVKLATDATFTSTNSGNITFGSTVDTEAALSTLTVNTAGQTWFKGDVGSILELGAITTDAPGTLKLGNGGSTQIVVAEDTTNKANATGSIAFNDTGGTTLAGSVTVNVLTSKFVNNLLAGEGDVTFAGPINSADGSQSLNIHAPGVTWLKGNIGQSVELASLTTNFQGGAFEKTLLGNGTDIAINTNSGQTFDDAVVLKANVTLTDTDASNITFSRTVDSDGTARNLTVNTAATTKFLGDVGATSRLATLTTDASGITELGNGDTIAIKTTGNQFYNDQVVLKADATFDDNDGGNIIFGTTVDTDGTLWTLTANTSGVTWFKADVGGDSPLGALTTDAPGTTRLGNDGGVVINVKENTNVRGVATGSITFNDAVILDANVTINALHTKAPANLLSGEGDVTFVSTVDSDGTSRNLTVNAAGRTAFLSLVGDGSLLNTLTTDNQGGAFEITQIGLTTDTAVSTLGGQNYNDAVRFSANTTLVDLGGGDIVFGSTADGGATGADLIVLASGKTWFKGDVGSINTLTSLTTDSGGTTQLGNGSAITVTTFNGQTYGDSVVLGSNTTLVSTNAAAITFSDTVNSLDATARNLTVNTTGTTWFKGNVGTTHALGTLTTNAGGSTKLGDAAAFTLTTTGAQSFNDDVTLSQNTTVNAGASNVAFGAKLDSLTSTPRNLTINSTGNTTFTGLVGSTQRLGTVTIPTSAGVSALAAFTANALAIGSSGTPIAGSASFTSVTIGAAAGAGGNVDIFTTGDITFTSSIITSGNAAGTSAGHVVLNTSGGNLSTQAITALGANGTTGGSGGTVTLTTSATKTSTIASLINTAGGNGSAGAGGAGGAVSVTGGAVSVASITTTGGNSTGVVGANAGFITLDATNATDANRTITLNGDLAALAGTGTTSGLRGGISLGSGVQADATRVAGADRTITGDNVTLSGTLDSANATPRSLTISALGKATLKGAVGLVNKLLALTVTGKGIEINNVGSTTVTGTTGAVTLNAGNTQTATNGFTPDSFLVITGTALNAGGNLILNNIARTDIPNQATIYHNAGGADLTLISGAAFTMGPNEKLTNSLGSITIDAVGIKTIGDLSANGSITIKGAGDITVQARDKGVSLGIGGEPSSAKDRGTDIVAKQITIDSHITNPEALVTATPNGVVSYNGGGTAPSAVKYGGKVSDFASLSVNVNGPVLDLAADGVSVTNPATALAGALPRRENVQLSQTASISAAQLAELRELYITPRDASSEELAKLTSGGGLFNDYPSRPREITRPTDYTVVVSRMSPAQVGKVLDTYHDLFKKPVADDASGQTMWVADTQKIETLKQNLQAAVDAYKGNSDKKFVAKDFRAFLLANSDKQAAAAVAVARLDLLFIQLGDLGLTSVEQRIARRGILSAVTPEGVTPEELDGLFAVDQSMTKATK